MLTTLATAMILHWVGLVTPGANVLLISQLAASGRTPEAVFASLGMCVVTFVWATLAIRGLSAAFVVVPRLRFILQIVGGLDLIYMAVKLWRSGQLADTNRGVSSALSLFAQFFGMTSFTWRNCFAYGIRGASGTGMRRSSNWKGSHFRTPWFGEKYQIHGVRFSEPLPSFTGLQS